MPTCWSAVAIGLTFAELRHQGVAAALRHAVQPRQQRTGGGQVDYEALRAHLLEHGALPDDLAAARFGRRVLAGLIAWPVGQPVFVGELIGASRPAWSPYVDARVSALASGYQFLLESAATLQR